MEFKNNSALIYVFDLDGVIYRGNQVLPHAIEVIADLRRRGHLVWFFTNNATKSRESYSIKLSSMGIPVIHRRDNDLRLRHRALLSGKRLARQDSLSDRRAGAGG